MNCRLLTLSLAVLALLISVQHSRAQDEAERSALLEFVERKLSAPNRQIRLNGLRGALSSNVAFDSITIADEQGVWLSIQEPQLVWNRSGLLRGRLEIAALTAERIDYFRQPVADDSLPDPEARGFNIPDLPVAVTIEELDVPVIAFGEEVFGLASELSLSGSMQLEGGSLTFDLAANRLDGPGGSLTAKVNLDGKAETLALDVTLQEPRNGVLASLLNLPGRPPVSLKIAGDAPIRDLEVALAFKVDEERILDGALTVDEQQGAYRAIAKLSGPLADILPPRERAFFGETSRLLAEVIVQADSGVRIETLKLDSGALRLDATASLLPDGFLEALNVELGLESVAGEPVVLPASAGALSLSRAGLTLAYDASEGSAVTGRLTVDDFRNDDLRLGKILLDLSGIVTDFSVPSRRRLALDWRGAVSEIAADEALQRALGERIAIAGSAEKRNDQPFDLRGLSITGEQFDLTASGKISDFEFSGDIALAADNIAAFSPLAGRSLGGGLELAAQGEVEPLGGGFDLNLSGTGSGLAVGIEPVDRLLTGVTELSGGVARNEEGLTFRGFRLGNQNFSAFANGRYASDQTDMNGHALIRDLGTINANASGPVRLDFALSGNDRPFDLTVDLAMESGRLAGREVRELALDFDGGVDGEKIAGALLGGGRIGSEQVELSGDLAIGAERAAVSDFSATIGATELVGDLSRGESGLLTGELQFDSSDISAAAALLLTEGSGAARGSLRLSPAKDRQAGSFELTARNIRFGDYRAGTLSAKAAFDDLFGLPELDGEVKGSNLSALGVDIRSLTANVDTLGETGGFSIKASLAQHDAELAANGVYEQSADRISIAVETLDLNSTIADARLQSPVEISVEGGVAAFSDARLTVGGGSIALSGSAGETLDLEITVNDLPLAIANALRPDLGAAGTLNGSARIGGSVSAPTATYTASASGVSLRTLREAGIKPLQVRAAGRYGQDILFLEQASVVNSAGVDLAASGQIPFDGGALSLSARGSLPLAIAEPLLRTRGARINGTARLDLTVGGTLRQPRAEGIVSVNNGTFVDPLSNLKLENIGLMAGLRGEVLSINRFSARLAAGGSVSASGTIALTGDLPADLNIRLVEATYTDGKSIATTASGTLRLTGSIARDPLLSGTLNLAETEILVPESFAADATLLDVDHVAPPPEVSVTLERLAATNPEPVPTARPSLVQLDITVNAPNRIFVRGRGLDTELGGQVRLTGPVTDISPVGEFNLIRGRLSIVGQRIELSQGTVRLAGDLDPILDFLAETRSGEIIAFIRLRGRVSDLEVDFSSSPPLPEDEVLAQIVFGRSFNDLSPLQLARLAAIAAELTGGNSPGLIDGIREGIGLDDIDVVQDAEGRAAVRAGKYIADNVYLGVEAGSDTEATINLDITEEITARGSVSSGGKTGIGIFYEKDY